MNRSRQILATFSFLLLVGCVSAGSPRLSGAWRQAGGERLLNCQEGRIIEFDGRLTVRGIVRSEPGLLLRNGGYLETWQISLRGDELRVVENSRPAVFRRLDAVPAAVDLKPLPLGQPRRIARRDAEKIQAEIAVRFRNEQAVYKDPAHRSETVAALRAQNLAYLSGLIKDIGWLDVKRFGRQVSVYAVILAKHTNDLRLMMTILPEAEKDLKYNGEGQTYAVLYDSLQLDLGGKQRYGTQIAEDANGEPVVLPLENPAKVDDYLKEVGLPPYKDYLKDIESYFYPGKKIQFAPHDGFSRPTQAAFRP